MRISKKKLKSGFEIPVFGIGTWRVGGDFMPEHSHDDSDLDAMKYALKKGITYIDTAEVYAMGHAEELVKQAIRNSNRQKLFISTKVAHVNLGYDNLLNSAKNSMKRLGLKYIDLYLVHSWNEHIPLSETMAAMDALVSSGLAKYIGVSNFNIDQMKQAQSVSKNKIVTNQVQYNLIYREPEINGVLEYCQKNDIILTAWRPIQKGLLTIKGTQILDEMCKKYNKTQAQISINWLISQPNVVTLSKCSNIEHIKENLGALNWSMDKGDIEKLRKEFPNQVHVSDCYRGLATLENLLKRQIIKN